jgi:outer membrane immunogenic protein
MKKLLLLTSAIAAILTAAPAMAADLGRPAARPVYAPPVVAVPFGYRWTGCYIGANGGGIWAERELSDPILARGDFGSHTASGGLGGFQAGCDYQRGPWVLGVAGDWDWASANSSHANPFFPLLTHESRVKSLASLTFRTGYAWDRTLLYVKGGGAWLQSDFDLQVAGTSLGTASETRRGWTVGVGGEYAFTDWISGFIEYDYYQFRDSVSNLNCTPAVTCGGLSPLFPVNVDSNVNVVKAGVNLRFGPGVRWY